MIVFKLKKKSKHIVSFCLLTMATQISLQYKSGSIYLCLANVLAGLYPENQMLYTLKPASIGCILPTVGCVFFCFSAFSSVTNTSSTGIGLVTMISYTIRTVAIDNQSSSNNVSSH